MSNSERHSPVVWIPTNDIDILSSNIETDFGDLPHNDELAVTEPKQATNIAWLPNVDIDAFASNIEINPNTRPQAMNNALYQNIERAFSSGMVWETNADDFIPNPEVEKTLYYQAIKIRNKNTDIKDFESILSAFDSWTGTPIDILSPYGDIDFGNNIFADNFALNVPVKIYSDADDLVFQVDAPWMKVESFDEVDLYPSRLNLKSVLSMLPVTVNSKELKASFIDGEFRLEVPKNEISPREKRKEG